MPEVMEYSEELALAHVAMRVGGLTNREDIARLREWIENEKAQYEAFIVSAEHQLAAIDMLLADSNTGSEPS